MLYEDFGKKDPGYAIMGQMLLAPNRGNNQFLECQRVQRLNFVPEKLPVEYFLIRIKSPHMLRLLMIWIRKILKKAII